MKKLFFILFFTLSLQMLVAQDANRAFEYFDSGKYALAAIQFEQLLPILEEEYGINDTMNYALPIVYAAVSFERSGEQGKSEYYYLKALDVFNRNSAVFNPLNLLVLSNLSAMYNSEGKYEKSENLLLKALDIRRKMHGKGNAEYLTTLNKLGSVNIELGKFAEAEMYYTEALDMSRDLAGEHSTDYAIALNNFAFLNQSLRNYPKAKELYLNALDILKVILGEKHPDYATVLNNLAQVYNSMGSYNKSETLYKQVAEIRKNCLGETHSDYALSLSDLGLLYVNTGKYKDAEELYLKALDITEKALGVESPQYLTILNNLAGLYELIGKLREAKTIFIKLVEVRRRLQGELNPDYVISLNNLGSFYYNSGDYQDAEQILLSVLKISKDIFGEDNIEYAQSLNNLALLYYRVGLYEKVENLYLQASAIIKKKLGPDHPDYASCLDNLAQFYSTTGEPQKAESLFIQSIEIKKEKLGTNNPDYAFSLNNLATLFISNADYQKAESLLIESSEIFKSVLGEDHPKYASSLDNLVVLYLKMGNFDKAESITLSTISIKKKSLGESHPDYAKSLINLAQVYHKINKFDEAEKYYKQGLEILNVSLGENHPVYAESLNNIAVLYESKGDFNLAETYFLQALMIRKTVLGENNGEYAQSLNNLALFYTKSGDFSKSESMYLQALDIFKNIMGENHPDYATALSNLAGMYFDERNYAKAEPLFKKSADIILTNIQRNFSFQSEQEQTSYFNTQVAFLKAFQSFCFQQQSKNPSLSAEAYNIELASKCIVLITNTIMRKLVEQSSDSIIQKTYEKWMLSRKEIANQFALPISKRTLNLDSIETISNTLEKQLALFSANFGDRKKTIETRWNDVQLNLKPNEAACEFTQIRYRNRNSWSDSLMYVAIVLRKNDTYPIMIPLCTSDQLDSLIQKRNFNDEELITELYRGSEIITDEHHYAYGQRLYQLIWQPIDSLLNGIEKVYYAPTGKLYQISFAAIPYTKDTLLSDKYILTQLTSTALVAKKNETHESQSKSLVLFGGIKYDSETDQLLKISKKYHIDSLRQDQLASRSLPLDFRGGSDWNYLEGTISEVLGIESIAKKNGLEPVLITGYDAVEEAFKSLGGKQSPQAIHIATHGFFFPDPKTEKAEDKFSLSQSEKQRTVLKSDNPLNRSGLLFAGANNAWSGKDIPSEIDDGILTAYEVSNVSLPTTQLVVLSACETGLGDIKGVEGVYGLQRAFKAAGVKYILMSLWNVPDKETSEFMQLFYSILFSGKLIPESFLETQSIMRAKYKNEPYKWAAFILVE